MKCLKALPGSLDKEKLKHPQITAKERLPFCRLSAKLRQLSDVVKWIE